MTTGTSAIGGGDTTLRGVQALRFLAAAMVVIGHVQDTLHRGRIDGLSTIADPTGIPWHAGVDVFFVISGFVMYRVGAAMFGRPGAAATFLRRRLVRIAPLYWAFTLLALATALLLPGKIHHAEVSASHVVASLLFVPWLAPSGQLVPLLSVGWTLDFEMMFYAVFAVALSFRRTVGLAVIVSGVGGLVLLRLVAPMAFGIQVNFWGMPITLEFLYGIGLCMLYSAGVRLPLGLRIALAVAAVAALSIGNRAGLNEFSDRWLYWGLPAAALVGAVVLGRDLPDRRWSRWLVLCGDASYALYLSHLFTLRLIGVAWSGLSAGTTAGYAVVAVVASIAVSIAVHLWFERPLQHRLRGTGGPRRPVPTAPFAVTGPAAPAPQER